MFTVSLIYGITFVIAPEVMRGYIPPFGFILLRVASGCLLFLLFHGLFIREKMLLRDLWPAAVSALFGVAANMLFFFKGLSITTPINSAVLMLVTPIFVFLFTVFYGKEKLPWYKWAGLFIAASGALLLVGGRTLHFSTDKWLGDLYIIINALSYAIYLVYVKKLMTKYHPITVSKWNFVFGLLMVLPFGWNDLLTVRWETFTPIIWWYVVFILIGTTFLTYLLNAWALAHASSSLVGSYIYLQPVVAALTALTAGKDSLSIEKMLFILFIFAGVYLVSLKPKSIAHGH